MSELKVKDLVAYRQPMVTSLGLILGFLLNFLANWATKEDNVSEMKSTADWIVASTLLPSLILMVIVLYRILDIRHQQETLEKVYILTFKLYMTAIVMALVGVGGALFF